MFMKRNWLVKALMVAMIVVSLCACGKNEPEEVEEEAEMILSVTIKGRWGASDDTQLYMADELKEGDVLYDRFGTITVREIADGKVELELTGGFVKPNWDGTINLRKEPLTEVVLESGEHIKLVTQTTDNGDKITIRFGGLDEEDEE